MPVKLNSAALLDAPEVASLTPKVGFVSLGCPKNLVDSEVMMGLLSQGGAQITARAEDADIIVVNTCSFIDTAKQESVDTILEMAQHKTAGRAKKLIVAGCLVERYRNEIQKNIPEVDAVVGTGELQNILAAAGIQPQPSQSGPFVILNSRSEGDAREAAGRFSKDGWDGAIADLPNYLYDENTPRVLATPKYTAYIKIAEGCDHPCTFCIIPQLRGKFRSRRFESVIAEAERLAKQGVREITLIGQDTTCYGEDLGLKDGLALLLERLAQIEDLRWVRFLYAYPNKITGKLLETIAAQRKDLLLHRCAAAARLARCPQAHEAWRWRRYLPEVDREDARDDSRPHAAHLVHRRLPRRDRQTTSRSSASSCKTRSSTGSASSATPMKKARRPTLSTTRLPPREIERRRKKLMSIQKQISRKKKRALVGSSLIFCSKALQKKPTCSGKAAPPCTLRKLTARSTSTTSATTKTCAGQILSLRDHRSPRLRPRGPHSVGLRHGEETH